MIYDVVLSGKLVAATTSLDAHDAALRLFAGYDYAPQIGGSIDHEIREAIMNATMATGSTTKGILLAHVVKALRGKVNPKRISDLIDAALGGT
jgi:hypothetical protein